MRNIVFTTLLFCSLVFTANSQTLEFSQVLLIPLTTQGDTVPQGKVWKVVSAVSELQIIQQHTNFQINNIPCTVTRSWYGGYSNQPYTLSMVNPIFPLWLPAGSIVKAGNYVNALSIIEFNE